MKRTTLLGMLISPLLSYLIILTWAFIDDTLLDGESAAKVFGQIGWIVLHSISFGHFLIFVAAALPATFAPRMLRSKDGARELKAGRLALTSTMMSVVPILMGGFIFHAPTAVGVGLACGLASALACYLISAFTDRETPNALVGVESPSPATNEFGEKRGFGRR